jgi:hypothetical protein
MALDMALIVVADKSSDFLNATWPSGTVWR